MKEQTYEGGLNSNTNFISCTVFPEVQNTDVFRSSTYLHYYKKKKQQGKKKNETNLLITCSKTSRNNIRIDHTKISFTQCSSSNF